MARKKKIKPICGNCRLFNPAEKRCGVIVLYGGQKYNLPVEAHDRCFYEKEFIAINDEGHAESFKAEVQQVKFWMEDPHTGKKVNKNGVVKIEYPEGFFGTDEPKKIEPTRKA
jgi:hypothetical protein